MCKLVAAMQWIDETFEETSKPTHDEVEDWVKNECIPGRIIGNDVFVEAQRFAYGETVSNGGASNKTLTAADILG